MSNTTVTVLYENLAATVSEELNAVAVTVSNTIYNVNVSSTTTSVVEIEVPGYLSPPPPIELFVSGLVGPSELLMRYIVLRDNLQIVSNLTQASCETPATSNAVFLIVKNANTTIGNVSFTANSTIGNVQFSNNSFQSNDVIKVIGPVSQDPTLANITIAFNLSY
jgi:hypothetical protein